MSALNNNSSAKKGYSKRPYYDESSLHEVKTGVRTFYLIAFYPMPTYPIYLIAIYPSLPERLFS